MQFVFGESSWEIIILRYWSAYPSEMSPCTDFKVPLIVFRKLIILLLWFGRRPFCHVILMWYLIHFRTHNTSECRGSVLFSEHYHLVFSKLNSFLKYAINVLSLYVRSTSFDSVVNGQLWSFCVRASRIYFLSLVGHYSS